MVIDETYSLVLEVCREVHLCSSHLVKAFPAACGQVETSHVGMTKPTKLHCQFGWKIPQEDPHPVIDRHCVCGNLNLHSLEELYVAIDATTESDTI